MSDSLVILDDEQVDQAERAELDAAAALQPVYESSDGTRIIVLPEIRVDVDASDHGRSLLDAVPSSDLGAALSEQRPGRYLIKLHAGTGNDALDLANNLVETIHPELAQARFVRVVNRPAREPTR